MRVAFLSDLHGNQRAVHAVLDALPALHVDQVVIGGDVIDPLPGSREVAELVIKRAYPCLRGNHEDYVIQAKRNPASDHARNPNWSPVRQVAASIPDSLLDQVERWPLTYTIDDESAGPLLMCHASPTSNLRGWHYGIDDALASELKAQAATMLICGHFHQERVQIWDTKSLVMSGSVGIPLHGRARAEFVILDSSSGRWEAQHESAAFDDVATWKEFLSSGWFKAGGPMAWLILDELRVHEGRMGRFFRWMKEVNWPVPLVTKRDWAEAAREYLKALGTWTELKRIAGADLTD